MNSVKCSHHKLIPEIVDQTMGVYCSDCDFSATCWDDHVSEYIWNLACKNSSEFNPCDQNRYDICFLCKKKC